MQNEQKDTLDEFNRLLQEVYYGNLRKFCDQYNDLEDSESFYKKVQQRKHRMGKQKVQDKIIDDFKKYSIFIKTTKIEQDFSWEEQKIFKQAKKFFGV